MDRIIIEGGNSIRGEVRASGSKNSGLKMIFASILTDECVVLKRLPKLLDVSTSLKLLQGLGTKVQRTQDGVCLETKNISSVEASYNLVRTMRASILLLGPLLARVGRARVSLPGGCAIGTRPVDLHLMGLRKMGAQLDLRDGYVEGTCPNGLVGANIELDFPSVGATENILLAATLAKGITTISGAAREPEITDLVNLLKKMGAKIQGEGSSTITIEGVNKLKGATMEVMFDRIEAATLLLAAAITDGSIQITGIQPQALTLVVEKLQECGLGITVTDSSIQLVSGDSYKPLKISTAPFPGFPTDLQAQFMAFLSTVEGKSEIEETIFENRFMHVPELLRMGADIRIKNGKAWVFGQKNCFRGATVMATDLRASASLVLAGLVGRGSTTVRRVYHLDRGYEGLEKKLRSLGANIYREKDT